LDENTKDTLRKYYREIRQKAVDKEKLSKIICGHIKILNFYTNALRPILYWACKSEVSLLEICEERWEKKEKFGLPRCLDKNGNMDVFEAKKYEMSFDCNKVLSPNPKNIILPRDIDCVFVPAIAFDNFGRRLGQGGGYYDRFLRKCGDAIKIGVCFSMQISQDPLPEDEKDERVSIIISEKGIIKV
jgi:5-formyltetrahydrofolate cyclo-ligase